MVCLSCSRVRKHINLVSVFDRGRWVHFKSKLVSIWIVNSVHRAQYWTYTKRWQRAQGLVIDLGIDICIYVHTHLDNIRIHFYMYIHAYIHSYLPLYMHTCIYIMIATHILTHVHTYICTCTHKSIDSYLHIYKCTYILTYI